ncbi:hypothetical protein INT43_003381 [Umbelopsis isabellina]|uniref:Uncharacterized protein n=1 Tax=Mortierella isabellina TaxID=91625 RepID=A0A8H7PQ56_MORIS|nr:hypothetical protein INT43_003381 [Umbelopsis isabellina]
MPSVQVQTVISKEETMYSTDRNSTGYSDISTLCQAKDFLPLTDEDKASQRYWIQYIPRKHPTTGVDVETTCAGQNRLKYRGMFTYTVCAAAVLAAVMFCFTHFRDQVYAPVPQMIQIYYSLLSFASLLVAVCIGGPLSVSLEKWRGILPSFIGRMDLLFVLSCGQWTVIRNVCTSNQNYFWPLLSNVLQALISQIFILAFAGGDVFNSYVALITSIATWYSLIPILIGMAFSATYLHSIPDRICFYPAEYDKVRPFVLAGKPGCYIVGANRSGCIHRMKEARCVRSDRWRDLEQNNFSYQFEIPLAGWQAASIKEGFSYDRNTQVYMLTNGTQEDVQRTMQWAVSTNENIYMQSYVECGLCACNMAQLLRCNIVVVQRSGWRASEMRSTKKTAVKRTLEHLFTPWKRCGKY